MEFNVYVKQTRAEFWNPGGALRLLFWLWIRTQANSSECLLMFPVNVSFRVSWCQLLRNISSYFLVVLLYEYLSWYQLFRNIFSHISWLSFFFTVWCILLGNISSHFLAIFFMWTFRKYLFIFLAILIVILLFDLSCIYMRLENLSLYVFLVMCTFLVYTWTWNSQKYSWLHLSKNSQIFRDASDWKSLTTEFSEIDSWNTTF